MSDATHSLTAIKDPSVVYFNNQWHVFASSVTAAGTYNMVYMTFPDWDHTADATFYYMDQTPGFAGYKAAPQVFFFAPQNKWYLVYPDRARPATRPTTTSTTPPAGSRRSTSSPPSRPRSPQNKGTAAAGSISG